MTSPLERLLVDIRSCAVCAPHLPHGVRPVVQAGEGARIVVVGQAPGAKVHASGVPWDDASGARIRDWMGIDCTTFYDSQRVALVPMGFCYPGRRAGGDRPPRPECAPLWHESLFAVLPNRRLTLLAGVYAHAGYLGDRRSATVTETVRRFRDYGPAFFPLPHPSWRSAIWVRTNPWFEADVAPALRAAVREALL
ncbi:uracil-DNA glycosylase family protein [Roseiarcus sp.]|uniref:uracil-DNA glycosylase family protein n=1 Tax=Roseiarcus sp. TaxID=1969460 RepID=UPI003F9B5B5D